MRTLLTAKFAIVSLIAVATTACTSETPAEHDVTNVGASEQAATTGISYDTTGIATYPTAALPTTPLPLSAFQLTNVQRALLQSSETFTAGPAANRRSTYDSRSWHAELDPSRGQVLAVSQLTPGAPVLQSDRMMESAAMSRLSAFGVPSAEVFTVWQRRSMTHDEQDGVYGTPEIDGYKTFAVRGINGVRIRGHRAVLTHGADGVFRRALLRWPALASSGHLLRTRLTTADIVSRVATAVQAEGLTAGVVTLDWVYAPAETRTGEVTLTLMAQATLPYDPALGESRVLEVGVDAL